MGQGKNENIRRITDQEDICIHKDRKTTIALVLTYHEDEPKSSSTQVNQGKEEKVYRGKAGKVEQRIWERRDSN